MIRPPRGQLLISHAQWLAASWQLPNVRLAEGVAISVPVAPLNTAKSPSNHQFRSAQRHYGTDNL